jgi:hypothetical protein
MPRPLMSAPVTCGIYFGATNTVVAQGDRNGRARFDKAKIATGAELESIASGLALIDRLRRAPAPLLRTTTAKARQ